MKLPLTWARPIPLLGLALLSVILAFLLTMGPCRATRIERWNELVIQLDRQGCFWHCPEYSLEIHGDGSLVYHGRQYVAVTGTHTATIDQVSVRELVQAFEAVNFYTLGDSYERQDETDQETIVVSLTVDGHTKTIRHYGGDLSAPRELFKLEIAIDEQVDSKQLTQDWRTPGRVLPHRDRLPVRWMPGGPTPTPSNAMRVAEMLKTPQPTPLPKPVANETGLVPGQTTQEQALAREGWLPGEVREHGWVYRYFLNQYRTAFFNGLVVQVELDGDRGTADKVIAQYGAPEVAVWQNEWFEWGYPARGLAFVVTCRSSSPTCWKDGTSVVIVSRHYFVPMTLQEWVAREQLYWPEGYYIQGWGR